VNKDMKLTRRGVLAGGAAIGAAATVSGLATRTRGATAAIPTPTERVPVAVLLDNHATMIDFAGPWEVFQDTGVADVPGFALYTVGPTVSDYVTSGTPSAAGEGGLRFRPDYDFTNAPQPRVVFMGAQNRGVSGSSPEKLEWVRKAAAGADVVMSVCTGAFILAQTGLLDGLSATTHHNFFDDFAAKYPRVKLERGRRFVDNGKFICAGGLTSGIDAALHVVERYYGPAATQKVADYMEYQSSSWRSNKG
jgi:transcriptional regulator GlxA family with amidase domain